MASGPITSWQIVGEKVETVADFIFLWSKITADGDCSHEIKRCLFLRRKVMSNLDSILKSRDITFPMKFHIVKAMVFPVVMHRCESWTIKKAEHWRTDTFEPWWRRRFLRVPWTARISNQSILKESALNIHWKDWYRSWSFSTLAWPPDLKSLLSGKDSYAGKDWRQEEECVTEDKTVGWHHRLNGHEFEQIMSLGNNEGQGSLACCSPWGHKELDMTEHLNNDNKNLPQFVVIHTVNDFGIVNEA